VDIYKQRRAIIAKFPDLAGADFTVMDAGWDSLAIDADDRLMFKFPKHQDAEARLRREVRFLEIVRPNVSMPVPDIRLHEGPPVFSSHLKLRGAHLLADGYARLSDASRRNIAEKLALFYAELHGISPSLMAAAGALPLPPWQRAQDILEKALPHIAPEHHAWARETLKAWTSLAEDPYGTVFGFYDGHGWNMAFDHERGVLNGIYDFADAGLGPLHQDFIYSSFIDEDLTLRIIGGYERITGKIIDRRRVDILTAVYRLHELADNARDPKQIPHSRGNVEAWARKSKNGPEGPF
jgi:aminoglycoside phosphotransferase (APT) family kinase protein